MKVLKTLLAAVLLLAVVGAIGLALLVHKGFRATTKPLPGKAAVARTVRNLAIPRAERDQKNPIEPTSEAATRVENPFSDTVQVVMESTGAGRLKSV